MKTTLDLPDHLMLQGLHGPAALPLYRPEPQLKRHPIAVATSLRLEQDTLMQEDHQRACLPA